MVRCRKYALKSFVLENVGEELGKKCVKRVPACFENLISLGENTFRWLWNKLPRYIAKFQHYEDMWQIATRRNNRFLGLTLHHLAADRSFNMYTYHMPCEFKRNDVMNIHAAGLLSGIQKHTQELPYILAGDFNSTPSSSVYALVTKSIYSPFPKSTVYSRVPSLQDRIYVPLTSAYFALHAREPPFTNYGWPKDLSKAFCDTIDYIFCNRGFEPVQATHINTTSRNDVLCFPSSKEPSDHLPLQASFNFAE